MKVSELKTKLEELEKTGFGDAAIVIATAGVMLEVLSVGTAEAWPDRSRLTTGEYRGEGQHPNKECAPVTVALIR